MRNIAPEMFQAPRNWPKSGQFQRRDATSNLRRLPDFLFMWHRAFLNVAGEMLFVEAAPNSPQRHTDPSGQKWISTSHIVVEFLLSPGRAGYVDSLPKVAQ